MVIWIRKTVISDLEERFGIGLYFYRPVLTRHVETGEEVSMQLNEL